jgi:hypothetical protein
MQLVRDLAINGTVWESLAEVTQLTRLKVKVECMQNCEEMLNRVASLTGLSTLHVIGLTPFPQPSSFAMWGCLSMLTELVWGVEPLLEDYDENDEQFRRQPPIRGGIFSSLQNCTRLIKLSVFAELEVSSGWRDPGFRAVFERVHVHIILLKPSCSACRRMLSFLFSP